jgi:hypothetical protein
MYADDQVCPGLGCLAAARSVQLRGLRTKLKHFSCDDNVTRSGQRHECLDHGRERGRVRVIAVVDQGGAIVGQDLPSTITRDELCQGRCTVSERNACLKAHGQRKQGIGGVVLL